MYSSSRAWIVSPVSGVDDREGIDLVAEQFDAVGELLGRGPDLDGVAADAELAALEGDVVALVLDVDEPQEQVVAVDRPRPSARWTIIRL